MNALHDFINSEIYENAKRELERMKERLKEYKGDKKPFQKTIEVFDNLLKSNASFRIDWCIQSAEVSKLEIKLKMREQELINALAENEKLKKLTEEGGRPLNEQELDKLADIILRKVK